VHCQAYFWIFGKIMLLCIFYVLKVFEMMSRSWGNLKAALASEWTSGKNDKKQLKGEKWPSTYIFNSSNIQLKMLFYKLFSRFWFELAIIASWQLGNFSCAKNTHLLNYLDHNFLIQFLVKILLLNCKLHYWQFYY